MKCMSSVWRRGEHKSVSGKCEHADEAALHAQEMTLSLDVARHFAEALTLLRRQESSPVDPTTLAGADVQSLVRTCEVRARAPQTVVDWCSTC